MNNLFNAKDVDGILQRLEQLQPDAPRQWGKMNAAQMLAHCNTAMETALGMNFPKRLLIGRILGPLVKPGYLSEKPMNQGSPTDNLYIISDSREFEKEKAKAKILVKQFFDGGPSKCTTHPHSFFGKLTPEQWAISQWKHFDHHLRQFNG